MSGKRPATIRQQDRFSRWAPAYGTDGLSGLFARLQWQALAALQPAETDRFLDVGCGTGAAVRGAARTVEFAVGVDLCPAMIEQARTFTGPMPGVARFLVADAQQLPFPDAAFTVVLCTAAARHFADLPAAVHEMVRVLRPDGRLVVADLLIDGTYPRTRASLRRRQPYADVSTTLLAAGLRLARPVVCCTPFGPYVIARAPEGNFAAPARRRWRSDALGWRALTRRVGG